MFEDGLGVEACDSEDVLATIGWSRWPTSWSPILHHSIFRTIEKLQVMLVNTKERKCPITLQSKEER